MSVYDSLRADLTKRFNLPFEGAVRKALRSLNLAEKSVFYILLILFVFSGLSLLYRVNNAYLVEVPIRGGTIIEGVIGNPRFINPVLAISDADKSLTSLVYSGLAKKTPEGEVVPDIADNIFTSENGLIYTVHIRDAAKFHDGEPVTADDVLFTIGRILDPNIKSPLYSNWAGVSVEKSSDRDLVFTLKKPYAPFIENLTLGILPRHIWRNVTADEFAFSQFNTLPVGSGPMEVEDVKRNSGGIPDYYSLVPFNAEVYLKRMVFKFYPNEATLLEAFDSGDIDALAGLSPESAVDLGKKVQIIPSPLPRVFGVFFNQSQSRALLDKSVRRALDLAAPKEEIVNTVLKGFGTVLNNPLPPSLNIGTTTLEYKERFKEAQKILSDNGWAPNPVTRVLEKNTSSGTITLSFSISTGNTPELKLSAEVLRDAWASLGADVTIEVFETGDLNTNIIRPRHFEALLFGEVTGTGNDLYPFWHSSERTDPGLNIAMYANSRVDKILESVRTERDNAEKARFLSEFATELEKDVPAVFLYSPSFIYVVPRRVQGITLSNINSPEDRFLSIKDWSIETDNVWNVFAQ